MVWGAGTERWARRVGAGAALAEALADHGCHGPRMAGVAGTGATPYGDAEDIRSRLARQVYGPVQWVATVQAIIAAGATSIIECGPGKALAGLIRRIDKGTPVACIDSNAGLQKALQL